MNVFILLGKRVGQHIVYLEQKNIFYNQNGKIYAQEQNSHLVEQGMMKMNNN